MGGNGNDSRVVPLMDLGREEPSRWFQWLFQALPVATTVTELDTWTFIEANPAFADLCGYPLESIRGSSAQDLGLWVNAADRDRMVANVLEHSSVHDWRMTYIRRGETRVREARYSGVVLRQGERMYLLGTLFDDAPNQHSERLLAMSRQRHQLLFEHMMHGVAYGKPVVRPDGRIDLHIREVNASFEDATGLPARQWVGHLLLDVLPGLDKTNPLFFSHIAEVLKTGERIGPVERWVSPLNRWVQATIFRLDETSLALTLQDVSDRRRYEDEVLRLNERLTRQVGEQTQELAASVEDMESFIYSISTRLQESLATVSAQLAGLREHLLANGPAGQHALLESAEIETRQMSALLEGAVRYLCMRDLPLDVQLVDLMGTVQKLRDEYELAYPQVLFQVSPLPRVSGSPMMIETIFRNLLDNAVKFSKTSNPPRIQIAAHFEDFETTFRVQDNGIGLSPGEAEMLFTPYSPVHDTHKSHGLGLGLAMARRLVERHGGKIWVESAAPEGTAILFTLGPLPVEFSSPVGN